MNIQIGSRLSAPIAQNGIFGRRLAAAMYGGSGGGGGGGAAAAAALRGVGPEGAAGAASPVVAGVAVAAGSPLGAASPPSDEELSPSAARRSRERFSRCSGISVMSAANGRSAERAPASRTTMGSGGAAPDGEWSWTGATIGAGQ